METNILIYIVAFVVAFMFVGLAYYIGNRYFIGFRLSNMEKKVTDYFTNEGYEWKKEDGVLNVKRQGINFRIFLRGEEGTRSTMLWVQYATQLEEDLSDVHWAGHTVLVNVLSDKHPSLNVSMNLDDHVLWVHYRADICSQNDFAFHFNGAFNDMRSLMNDYSEILPKLQVDFPLEKKKHNPIGFA